MMKCRDSQQQTKYRLLRKNLGPATGYSGHRFLRRTSAFIAIYDQRPVLYHFVQHQYSTTTAPPIRIRHSLQKSIQLESNS